LYLRFLQDGASAPKGVIKILCLVDRASPHNRVNKNQLDAQLIT